MAVAFLYLIILIGSQLTTCSGACSVLDDNPSREEIIKCQKLLKILRKAIINDEENMFILRDVFTSASHPPPSSLDITYKVYLKKHHASLFHNSLPTEWFNITVLWSNSQIFTIVNPLVIFLFQPIMLTLAYIFGEGITNTPTISLNLYVPEDSIIPLNPNVSHLQYSFTSITKQLQNFPPEQKEMKKGFSIPLRFIDSIWDNYTILIVVSTIILVVTGQLMTIRYVKVFSEHIRDNTTYNKLNYFWSFMIVVSIFNILEMLFQVTFIAAMLSEESQDTSQLLSIKMIVLGLAILSMIIGIGFAYVQPLKDIFPLYLLHLVEASELPSNTKPLRHIHSLAMCNLFLFVSLICISFVTTMLLTLIFPILTLSLLMYIITSVFCFVTFTSASTSCGLSLMLVKAGKTKACKAICSQACNSVPYILMFLSVNTILLFFLIVLHKSEITNTSSIFQSASSFFPSLILAALGYFTTKFASKKTVKDKPRDESDDSLEEGRAHVERTDDMCKKDGLASQSIQIQNSCEQRHGWLIKSV